MIEYNLKVNEETGKVRYVMVQKGANVQGETSLEGALWMLKRGKVRTSDEIEGYPLTADGVYFFEVEGTGDGGALSPAARVLPHSGGEAKNDEDGAERGELALDDIVPEDGGKDHFVELGADGLPLLAGDGTKRRRRRVKDRVCE